MKATIRSALMALALVFAAQAALADEYSDAIDLFKNAGQSGAFFGKSYAYAVFPSVVKAGIGIGGARGNGRAYENGKYVGDTTVTQVSVGAQLGAQGYSEIIFFEDKRAFDEFTTGNFEFDASVGAIAITASAQASAGSTGTSGSAGGGKKDTSTTGAYRKGLVVFTIAKGGLMYEATVAGQKFKYKKI